VTLGKDNGTDGQTDGQTDRQSATHNAAPSLGGGPHEKQSWHILSRISQKRCVSQTKLL